MKCVLCTQKLIILRSWKAMKQMKIIEKLVEFFLQKCQKGLEESIKWSNFVFDTDHLLHCKFLKVNLNRSGSRIDFLLNGEKAIKQ